VVETKIENAADEGSSGAGHRMTTAPVGELLAANPVLLCVESEAGMSGGGDGMQRGCQKAKGGLTDLERDILEGQRPIGAGRTVFARAKKEKETNPGQVDRSSRVLVRGVGDEGLSVVKDLDGQGLHARWGRVRPGPSGEHV